MVHTHDCVIVWKTLFALIIAVSPRPLRIIMIMPAEKLAEFGTFSGKFHACLVCG